MNNNDTYFTIKSNSEGVFKDKGSRFLAFAIRVSTTEEIKAALDDYRKRYHDARHHCYAYVLGPDRQVWRTNDDGEPSGTAGKPIMGQINSAGLTNILVIVVRYFGGTLLGTSGLINAYKTAAHEAISHSEKIECTVKEYYRLGFEYPEMNQVMKVVKDEKIEMAEQDFGLTCTAMVSFRTSVSERMIRKLSSINNVNLTYIETR